MAPTRPQPPQRPQRPQPLQRPHLPARPTPTATAGPSPHSRSAPPSPQGPRRTRQRDAIAQVLATGRGPMSPSEVYRAARQHVQRLGLATVYRTIKSMADAGEIVEVPVAGEPPRYEPAGRVHHHHFLCRCCGKLFEVEGCPGDLAALVPRGFTLETHDLTLMGRCDRCPPPTPSAPPHATKGPAPHKHGPRCAHDH